MSSIDDTEAAINAAVDGPPPEEPEVEEVESGADDGAPAESEPILGKFKSQDDLVKAYQELERQFTQQRQAEPEVEEEPEQPFDVWGGLGSTMDEETERQVATRVYQDPAGMMRWAEHPDTAAQFGPQIAARVYATWQQFDPYGAARYAARAESEHLISQPRQELEQMKTEWQIDRAQKDANAAFGMLTSNLPDLDQYAARVHDLMNEFPLAEDHPLNQTAEGIAQYAEYLYWIARGEEFKRQEAASQQEQPANAAGKKARTQTRSTATPTSGAPMEDDQFLEEVLAGQPGRN